MSIYVISRSFAAYAEFLKESASPELYTYCYSEQQLLEALRAPELPEVLFFEEWYKHPEALAVIRLLITTQPSLLSDVHSMLFQDWHGSQRR
jgi:hypothetical protein